MFGNLKTWSGGAHRGAGHDRLQAYVDELTFQPPADPDGAVQVALCGLASSI